MSNAIIIIFLIICVCFMSCVLIIEKRRRKKLDNELILLRQDLKKAYTEISDREKKLNLEKENLFFEQNHLEKFRKIFITERDMFSDKIQDSLDELGKLAVSKFYISKEKFCIDNFSLYPELAIIRNSVSIRDIIEKFDLAKTSVAYSDFKSRRLQLLNASCFSVAYGFIYVMFNISMPGVLKIGCSDAPLIRAKELTTGDNFRNNDDYINSKKEHDKYSIRGSVACSNALHNYIESLNIKLKTALPSPFVVAFFFESYDIFEDETTIHYALKELNIHRGAGIEFFALTLQEAYEILKAAFPTRGYQFINFEPK